MKTFKSFQEEALLNPEKEISSFRVIDGEAIDLFVAWQLKEGIKLSKKTGRS